MIAAALLLSLCGCTVNPNVGDAGSVAHSCSDCAQALACCQAVLAIQGNTTSECASSEPQCQGLPLDQQREYIFDCDSYLMSAPLDAGACQYP